VLLLGEALSSGEMMRIALVSTDIGLRSTGMTSFLTGLTEHLCNAGQQITVVTSDIGYRGDSLSPVAEFDRRVKVSLFRTRSALNRRLYRAVDLRRWLSHNASQFDVVHIQGIWSFVAVEAATICALQKVPYIITPHGQTAPEDWQKRPILKTLFFRAFWARPWKRAAAIHFLSKGELDNSVIQYKDHAVVIANAVARPSRADDAKLGLEFKQKFAIPLATPVVLYMGRLHAQKGVAEIVNAFQLLRGRGCHNAALVFAGTKDSSYAKRFIRMTRSSSRDNSVWFTGPLYGEDKWGALSSASVFITLSTNEAHPIAPLEAMSFGVPVVLTENSNIPEVSQYRAGLIVKRDHIEAAEALQRILLDKELAAGMAANAFRLAQDRFSWRGILPQMLDLYRTAANSPLNHSIAKS
jgi:glycosyltransferase involved in cell wall biosynthesis